MNILFCGSCLPRTFEAKIQDLSVAGNQYQNNLIKNLKSKGNVHVLSYIGISLDIPEKAVDQCQTEGYKPVIAHNKGKAIIEYRKQLRKEINWADVVITYNDMYPWINVGRIARKKDVKTVLVLADYTPPIEEKNIIKKLYSFIMGKDFKQYSKVILLSEGSRKYTSKKQEIEIINGCIDINKFKNLKKRERQADINIVYTGVLSCATGIDLLLNAFSQIEEKNYRLIICGQGHEEDLLIQEACNRDSRIIFKGLVSNEEYIEIINSADLLINPRNMNYNQNLNNFPSKVLEYISSGRPILSTKFVGWENYCDYITFCDSTSKDIKSKIEKAINCNLKEVFEKNRMFSEKLTWKNQIDKFI